MSVARTHEDAELSAAIILEAVEGAAIAGWATVDEWDGHSAARITETGGTVHVIDVDVAQRGLLAMRSTDSDHAVQANPDPSRIDSGLADSVVQFGLFGWIVYR